ncbi:hypothetical protein B0H14DRAFT_2644413 [Mycena olivaceomarginata]|nr:hypothetical protein B0H14DRAFT_2644413 [Mycena olivaceomarginata]
MWNQGLKKWWSEQIRTGPISHLAQEVCPSEGQPGARGVSDTIESSSSETVTEEGGVAGPETGTVQPVSSGDGMIKLLQITSSNFKLLEKRTTGKKEGNETAIACTQKFAVAYGKITSHRSPFETNPSSRVVWFAQTLSANTDARDDAEEAEPGVIGAARGFLEEDEITLVAIVTSFAMATRAPTVLTGFQDEINIGRNSTRDVITWFTGDSRCNAPHVGAVVVPPSFHSRHLSQLPSA